MREVFQKSEKRQDIRQDLQDEQDFKNTDHPLHIVNRVNPVGFVFPVAGACWDLLPEDEAGGGGVGVEFALRVKNFSFCCRRAAADVDRFCFAADLARLY